MEYAQLTNNASSTATVGSMDIRLRLVQLYYVGVLVLGTLFAAFTNPANLEDVYDLSMFRAVFQMATSAQAIWLIQRRSKHARTFCIATTSICIVLSAIDLFLCDGKTYVYDRMGYMGGIALVAVEYVAAAVVVSYLLNSKSARKALCVEPDMSPEGPGHSWDVPLSQRIKTWTFWRDLLIYFMTFSFLGHWAEILFCRLIIAGVFMGDYDPTNAMLWDQWLFPFSAEGIALAAVVLLLHPVKERLVKAFKGKTLPALVVSFLVNALVCTSIDFLTGITANQDYSLWDYRALPFNFMGQVCLQNSLVYSIAATIIVWVVYPLMDRGLRSMPRSSANMLFFGLAGLYLFEAALHFIVV